MKRFLQITVGGVMFGFCFVPLILGGIYNIGSAAGMTFFGGMFLWGVFRSRLVPALEKIRGKRAGKILTSAFCVCIAAGLLLCAAESGLMIRQIRHAPEGEVTVVVLGCKVNGEKPSKTLNTRILAAEKYLRENENAVAVLSGGKGEDEEISEAECMFRELTARGIAAERLYKEERSSSTRENMAFSLETVQKEGLPADFAVVTSEYHEFRAALIAKRLGINASAIPAATPKGLLPVYWIRELFGILYETLTGR